MRARQGYDVEDNEQKTMSMFASRNELLQHLVRDLGAKCSALDGAVVAVEVAARWVELATCLSRLLEAMPMGLRMQAAEALVERIAQCRRWADEGQTWSIEVSEDLWADIEEFTKR